MCVVHFLCHDLADSVFHFGNLAPKTSITECFKVALIYERMQDESRDQRLNALISAYPYVHAYRIDNSGIL